MAEIIKADKPFTRYDMAIDEGMSKLQYEGSKYKIDKNCSVMLQIYKEHANI